MSDTEDLAAYIEEQRAREAAIAAEQDAALDAVRAACDAEREAVAAAAAVEPSEDEGDAGESEAE